MSEEKKTQVIAEIGWNHMGDMELAKKMILEARDAGAAFAKFQTWSVKRLKPGPWDDDGRTDIYKKAELTEDKHKELIDYCNSVGIEFMTSVFSVDDAKLAAELGLKSIKIPSAESRNTRLIEFCFEIFDKIFMSVGTSTMNEVESLIESVDRKKLVLFHCVSFYPCPINSSNLPRINLLKTFVDEVGYSDHTGGVECSKMSLEYGISYLEKHFTVDHNLPGRDNKFAILPEELKELCQYIDDREGARKHLSDDYLEVEQDTRDHYAGRFDG